jgi:hypothetical protein
MNKGKVGEERGGKEMDGCPLTLPVGWTNSVLIFHNDVTFILQAEIPHVTIPYINDVLIKGPTTT